ncbi:MAG: site-specific integrase [Planctomycetota bacterium]
MASRSTRPNGHQWIFFSFGGKRHTVRLGKVKPAVAADFQRRIELAIETKNIGLPYDPETRAWVASLGDRHHANLAKAGLAEPRGARTLKQLCDAFVRHLEREGAKPRTIANVKVVTRNLLNHFSDDQKLETLGIEHAADFRSELRDFGRVGGGSLERTTVSRRVRRAREIFEYAVDCGWIEVNPFAKQKRWNEVNTARDHYIAPADIAKLIRAAPSAEWKLLIALTRYAGVRCPSEVQALLWEWINDREGTLRVYSPKTAHHPGRDWRTVPIFAEFADQLTALRREALIGQTHVFPNCQANGSALTAKLNRICKAAKVEPWPKAWVNMRASAERDLLLNHPIDDVASWLGHSPQTALRHYNRVAKDQRTRDAGRALRVFKGGEEPEVKGEAS